jgi:O-antigen/teichoic acid export membrane protein
LRAQERGGLQDELAELRSFFLWWATPALVVIALALLLAGHVFAAYFPRGFLGAELQTGWRWIVWSVPITLATNWLRGALEGVQRFAHVNLLRTVFGAWTYAMPAAVALYVPTLDAMIAAIVVGRLAALLAHAWACLRVEPGIVVGSAPRRAGRVGLFFREGRWITVSNLASPLMVCSDRFVLAVLLPAKAVAWYVTSQETMLRTLVIPGALSGVMFPNFAGASKAQPGTPAETASVALYQRGVRLTTALMLPLCALPVAPHRTPCADRVFFACLRSPRIRQGLLP